MRTPYSQFTSLIVIVAALALVGGITIVLVTSRDSLELAPEIWFGAQATPVAEVTQPPPSPTAAPAEATATPTAQAQAQAATATLPPSPTLEPSPTPTSEAGLPEGVTAIGQVDLAATAARLRDAPGGRVIGALLKGTRVEVLEGREVVDGLPWIQVRAETGETGWIAETLVVIITTADVTPAASPEPAGSPTLLPTLPGGVVGSAVIALDSGTAARMRDAPGGRVIAGLLDGAPVQVLAGREVLDGIVWIEVQDETGQTGWVSEDLLEYTSP